MSYKRQSLTICAVLWTLGLGVSQARGAENDGEIDARLQLFQQDTPRAMALHPQKTDVDGRVITVRESVFSDEDIQSRAYVLKKAAARAQLCRSPTGEILCPEEAQVLDNDRVENLVDDPDNLVTRLEDMESRRLRSGRVTSAPWSDDYWPYYKGTTAARYADASFPASLDWKENHDYVDAKTAASIVRSGVADDVDNLSPAEKYDLVVGDGQYTLTRSMWNFGKPYYDADGTVEGWMGICDGWASASTILARPGKAIQVTGADGQTKVTFYPSDIKALASTLWSTGYKSVKLVGGRCHEKNPVTDANGRILSQDCFDTNPGTWHQALVNQIGVSKRSFVIDAQYDYEVWNQPMVSYQYVYFNPQTLRRVRTLAEATVQRDAFTADKFKTYRSPNAAAFVGIAMQAVYVQETSPTHNAVDTAAYDFRRAVTYLYDLELDASGKIIGGEWYQNQHPNFLWVVVKDTQASSVADGEAPGSWESGAIPASWSAPAARASASGQPLGKVVQQLVKQSSGG